jgi:RNA polymerase-binding transcription factor DksA
MQHIEQLNYERNERKKAYLALEQKYLHEGISDISITDFPVEALRRMGNLAYLVWLLNYEPIYRNFRCVGENAYPPDWEWRRRFVFLRDRGVCQRCKKHFKDAITLDCHHIKPISEFAYDEIDIHSLANLISLCPKCHASKHPGNTMLINRAKRIHTHKRHLNNNNEDSNFTAHTLPSPESFNIHPSPLLINEYIAEVNSSYMETPDAQATNLAEPQFSTDSKSIEQGLSWIDKRIVESQQNEITEMPSGQLVQMPNNANSKSIQDGLALIDEQISAIGRKESNQRFIDEDIYGNCAFCDKEILIDPFCISKRGQFLCDACYTSLGRDEE